MPYDSLTCILLCDHDAACRASVAWRPQLGDAPPDGWTQDSRYVSGLPRIRYFCPDHAWRAASP